MRRKQKGDVWIGGVGDPGLVSLLDVCQGRSQVTVHVDDRIRRQCCLPDLLCCDK